MQLLRYDAKVTVVHQGEEGDSFYIILKGKLAIFAISKVENAVPKHITDLQAGDAFGEMSLIYGAPRAATVITTEPVELIVIKKDAYDKVLKLA